MRLESRARGQSNRFVHDFRAISPRLEGATCRVIYLLNAFYVKERPNREGAAAPFIREEKMSVAACASPFKFDSKSVQRYINVFTGLSPCLAVNTFCAPSAQKGAPPRFFRRVSSDNRKICYSFARNIYTLTVIL